MFQRLTRSDPDARNAVLNALPKGGVGVEIGVWKGDFSARILQAAKPQTLHLIDPWLVSDEADRADEAWYGAGKVSQADMDRIHKQVTERFAQDIAAQRVRIHRAAAAEGMAGLPESSVDFVYVDGDHAYEAVRADLAAAFRATKPGGLICCDDYLLGAWWGDGVVRAVHEFVLERSVIIQAKQAAQIVLRKLSPAMA